LLTKATLPLNAIYIAAGLILFQSVELESSSPFEICFSIFHRELAVKTSAIRIATLTTAIAKALAISPLMLAPQIVAAQDVDLGNLGDRGFRIDGIDARDQSGWSVSGAGDVNGDGLADLIVGADFADPDGDSLAGESYVVFGKADSASVDLASLGSGGFRIDGIDTNDFSGSSVSGAGDVNGDGLADLIVGASGADPGGVSFAGESYVVFSASAPLLNATYRVRSRNGSNPPRTPVGISGDGSNDSTPDARFWIIFADGDDPINEASLEVVTLTRSPGEVPMPGALVSWRLQSSRQDWSAAEVTVRYLDSELLAAENALELVYSPNGSAPYTPLVSQLNPQNNTISAIITQPGYFYIGQVELPDPLFSDRFESPAP
jgi:hypothetical protein